MQLDGGSEPTLRYTCDLRHTDGWTVMIYMIVEYLCYADWYLLFKYCGQVLNC